jgi:ankyrin repeat protein
LIDLGLPVDATDGDKSLLVSSVWTEDHKLVAMLIRRGANVNACNESYQPAIFYAVRNENLNMVKQLIAAGADLNCIDSVGPDNLSILEFAAKIGDVDICVELIKNGADWLYATETRAAVSHRLIEVDDGSIIDLILRQENCFTRTSQFGFTLTHWLSHMGDAFNLRRAIKAGALIDAQDSTFEQTALHYAMLGDSAECVEFLLNSGANVSLTNDHGLTAIQLGIGCEAVNSTVQYLTSRKFSPLDILSDPTCGTYLGHSLEDLFKKSLEALRTLEVLCQPHRSLRSAETIMDVFSESTAHAGVAAQPELQIRPKTMRL